VKLPSVTANELTTSDIIGSYVTQTLPTGMEFVACCALAESARDRAMKERQPRLSHMIVGHRQSHDQRGPWLPFTRPQ
jgi:hypothetical protein